jgi:uroporphyrin-III C-methyltransferase
MSGKVYLVGAGPGDPELLTLMALRVLRAADVVLHDDLVTPGILELIPPTTRVYNVGKRCGRKKITQEEINVQIVAYASAGLTIVRLKGGDPLIFSRAGEEMEALRAAGVPLEVVPGVTAASAAAAAARIPLTDRRLASKLVFLTGHHCGGKPQFDWPAALAPDTTIVLYMPGNSFLELAGELTCAGVDPDTPCLIISQASTPDEQIHRTILAELSQAPRWPPPAILIIGAVTALGHSAELFEATGAGFKR